MSRDDASGRRETNGRSASAFARVANVDANEGGYEMYQMDDIAADVRVNDYSDLMEVLHGNEGSSGRTGRMVRDGKRAKEEAAAAAAAKKMKNAGARTGYPVPVLGSLGKSIAYGVDYDDAFAPPRTLMTPTGAGSRVPATSTTPGSYPSSAGLPETTPGGTVKPRPPNQSRENRRVRQFRSASEITQEELSSCFHLPSEAACRKLGIGLTVLKRQCRKYGINRWPFRKMKSLDRLITNVQAGISPGDQNKLLVKSVEELEDQKRRMEECQVLDLDDTTKRLQQAYSKANHKARRNRFGSESMKIRGVSAELDPRRKTKKNDAYGLLSLAGVLSNGGEYGAEAAMDDEQDIEYDEEEENDVERNEYSEIKQEAASSLDISKMLPVAQSLPSNVVAASPLSKGSPMSKSKLGAVMGTAEKKVGAAAVAVQSPSTPKSSNVMVKKGSAKGDEFAAQREALEKPLLAVKGAWSPARPATRKSDAEEPHDEAFLSPILNKRKVVNRKPEDGGAEAKRAKPYTGAKRGRKKKNANADDDPLASLAAAALGQMAPPARSVGRPRKTILIATKGASASAKDSKESSAKEAATTTTASAAAMKDTAVSATTDSGEDHPAFAVPVVKGARTARTRLNAVDHSYYKRHIETRMAELRDLLVANKSSDAVVNFESETSKLVGELETLSTRRDGDDDDASRKL